MLLHAFIMLAVFRILWYGNKTITDTPIYYDYASRIFNGLFPYRDFASEYPPLALLLFSLPRLLSGSGFGAFVWWFEFEMLVFSWGIIAFMTIASWRLWQSLARTAAALAAYTAFVLCLGAIVESRFDLAVAFITLASLTCYLADRRLAAWLLLGIGMMTKIVPVLVAPIYLIIHFRKKQYGEMWLGPAAMTITALIIALPFLLASPGGLAASFLYHVERPLQLESTWSSPLLIMSKLGGYEVHIMNSYGSHNVFATVSDTLAMISGPVTVIMLAGISWMFFRRSGKESGAAWLTGEIFRFAAAFIAVFILFGKVFSPQFLIWLLPLVPLVRGRNYLWITGLFAAVLLLTQWEFPYRYWELYLMETRIVVIVALRNALLGLMVVVLLTRVSRRESAAA